MSDKATPTIERSDGEEVDNALSTVYLLLESLSVRLDLQNYDPADAEHEVTAEHIADLAALLDTLDTELAEFAQFREKIGDGLRWLVAARRDQAWHKSEAVTVDA